jgi:SAM-dependent methyltransferase
MTATKERRETFDEVAELYDEVRPAYPAAMFEDIVSLSGIPDGGRILEVGCGTGKATLPFAVRGYPMTCVELGEALAAFARRKLANHPNVEVVTSSFEDWPIENAVFDLALFAQSFHWIDPALGPDKLARALRIGGAVALAWNVQVTSNESRDFFEVVQEVYREVAPELTENQGPLPNDVDVSPHDGTLAASGRFGIGVTRRYPWSTSYDALGYTKLLSTYSDHRQLPTTVRERLLERIATLIETRFGGWIPKAYVTVLYLAHRAV